MWWFVQLLNVWLFEMAPKLRLMFEVFSQWSLKLKWSTQVYKLTYYFKTNYPDPAAFEMIIYNYLSFKPYVHYIYHKLS